ncbi:MAG: hypothetical protein PHY43_03990 [Verrucomicrobiales bacterium]|nr:hypothetical protein [Verrucomicrobiales bacterium]
MSDTTAKKTRYELFQYQGGPGIRDTETNRFAPFYEECIAQIALEEIAGRHVDPEHLDWISLDKPQPQTELNYAEN